MKTITDYCLSRPKKEGVDTSNLSICGMNDSQLKVMWHLQSLHAATCSDIARCMGVGMHVISPRLSELEHKKLIVRAGKTQENGRTVTIWSTTTQANRGFNSFGG